MKIDIEITVGSITKKYRGDKDKLYNNDWNEIVRDIIDSL